MSTLGFGHYIASMHTAREDATILIYLMVLLYERTGHKALGQNGSWLLFIPPCLFCGLAFLLYARQRNAFNDE